MSLIIFVTGLATGILLGVGAVIFYFKWKMGKELGKMENEMENLMEMTSEVQEMDWDENESLEIEDEEE